MPKTSWWGWMKNKRLFIDDAVDVACCDIHKLHCLNEFCAQLSKICISSCPPSLVPAHFASQHSDSIWEQWQPAWMIIFRRKRLKQGGLPMLLFLFRTLASDLSPPLLVLLSTFNPQPASVVPDFTFLDTLIYLQWLSIFGISPCISCNRRRLPCIQQPPPRPRRDAVTLILYLCIYICPNLECKYYCSRQAACCWDQTVDLEGLKILWYDMW